MRRLILTVALVPALAFGQAITIKRAPKVGDILKYRLTSVVTVFGNDVFYTSIVTQKIVDVAKDGSYTVQSTQSEIKANSGNDLPVEPGAHPSETTYDSRGMPLMLKGEQAGEPWRIADMSAFILPDKPVSKGDNWTFTIPPQADRNTPGGTYQFTNDGPEPDKVDDMSALRISEQYQENTKINAASSVGTIWVDPSDGTVVKLDEQWHNAPILGIGSAVNGRVSYERVR